MMMDQMKYGMMMMDTPIDWRYSDEMLKARQSALSVLLSKYGSDPKQSRAIYECAHDWVSQGNRITAGLVNFFKVYYEVKGDNQTGQESIETS